jgi:hypothetical protein
MKETADCADDADKHFFMSVFLIISAKTCGANLPQREGSYLCNPRNPRLNKKTGLVSQGVTEKPGEFSN